MELQALLTLSLGGKQLANLRRITLLKQISNTGSISQGAKLAGISYKAAWDAVNDMNTALPQPVINSEKGGKGGGGAKLTEFGERLLKVYSITAQVQAMALDALLDDSIAMDSLLDLMAYFSLNTSARNQLKGCISSIEPLGLNDRILVTLGGGLQVQISVTHTSSQRLQLDVDKVVLLLFKAPSVAISIKKSARDGQNSLEGCLLSMTELGDKVELAIDIGGKDVVYSVMPLPQFKHMAIEIGARCFVCFDASQIIIASMDG